MSKLPHLNGIEVDKVRKKGELIITEVVISREGDLLVDHVEAIMSRDILIIRIATTK